MNAEMTERLNADVEMTTTSILMTNAWLCNTNLNNSINFLINSYIIISVHPCIKVWCSMLFLLLQLIFRKLMCLSHHHHHHHFSHLDHHHYHFNHQQLHHHYHFNHQKFNHHYHVNHQQLHHHYYVNHHQLHHHYHFNHQQLHHHYHRLQLPTKSNSDSINQLKWERICVHVRVCSTVCTYIYVHT